MPRTFSQIGKCHAWGLLLQWDLSYYVGPVFDSTNWLGKQHFCLMNDIMKLVSHIRLSYLMVYFILDTPTFPCYHLVKFHSVLEVKCNSFGKWQANKPINGFSVHKSGYMYVGIDSRELQTWVLTHKWDPFNATSITLEKWQANKHDND